MTMTFHQFISAAATNPPSNPIERTFRETSEAYPHGVHFEASGKKARGIGTKVTIRINGSVVPFEPAHFIWNALLQGEKP